MYDALIAWLLPAKNKERMSLKKEDVEGWYQIIFDAIANELFIFQDALETAKQSSIVLAELEKTTVGRLVTIDISHVVTQKIVDELSYKDQWALVLDAPEGFWNQRNMVNSSELLYDDKKSRRDILIHDIKSFLSLETKNFVFCDRAVA